MKEDILKSGLKALYYTQAHRLLAPVTEGLGLIYMLHQVSPAPDAAFAPNGILRVDPDFLDAVIAQVRSAGLDIVTLDEARARILAGGSEKRFVCFTLDDGYRDNLEYALPVFRKHGAPFTIYIPSDYPSGEGELWWLALEDVIAGRDAVTVDLGRGEETFDTGETGDKQAAYHRIYWHMRALPQEAQRVFIRGLCDRYAVDMAATCHDLIMSWDEVRALAAEPLATIGAHTVGHYAVAKLGDERAYDEMKQGADRLAKQLGAWPRHFSFPYGDEGSAGPRDFKLASQIGFETAVTTRKGVLFPEHKKHLTALPRVSLNGAYQSLVYTQLWLTGAPFALWNRFRKVNAD